MQALVSKALDHDNLLYGTRYVTGVKRQIEEKYSRLNGCLPSDHSTAAQASLETQVLDNLFSLVKDPSLALRQVRRLSERTLARRRSEGRFTPEESDRLYRTVNLYARTVDVHESVDAASDWMSSPAVALGGRTPFAYAQNEPGTKRVLDLLTRIEHGVFS